MELKLVLWSVTLLSWCTLTVVSGQSATSSFPTQFSCSSRLGGYYADVGDQCRSYHLCGPTGRHFHFACPPGTQFNQRFVVCDYNRHVDCPQSDRYFSLNRLIGQIVSEQAGGGARGISEDGETVEAVLSSSFSSVTSDFKAPPLSVTSREEKNEDSRSASGTGARAAFSRPPNLLVVAGTSTTAATIVAQNAQPSSSAARSRIRSRVGRRLGSSRTFSRPVRPSPSTNSAERTSHADSSPARSIFHLLLSVAEGDLKPPPGRPISHNHDTSRPLAQNGASGRGSLTFASPTDSPATIGHALVELAASNKRPVQTTAVFPQRQSASSDLAVSRLDTIETLGEVESHGVTGVVGEDRSNVVAPSSIDNFRPSRLPADQLWRVTSPTNGPFPSGVLRSARFSSQRRLRGAAASEAREAQPSSRRRPPQQQPQSYVAASGRQDAGWSTARERVSTSQLACGRCVPGMIVNWTTCSPCVRAL